MQVAFGNQHVLERFLSVAQKKADHQFEAILVLPSETAL